MKRGSPPSLAALQAGVREAMLSSRRKGDLLSWIEPLGGIPPERSLGLARELCRERMRECLQADFPSVAFLLGPELFSRVALQYLSRFPFRSFSALNMGWKFPGFLSRSSASGEIPYLADLAALEWEIGLSGYRDRCPLLEDPDVAGLSADAWARASLEFDPSVRLVRTRWPVEAVVRARAGEISALAPADAPRGALLYRHPTRGPVAVSLSDAQFAALEGIRAGSELRAISRQLLDHGSQADVAVVLAGLGDWVREGVISRIRL